MTLFKWGILLKQADNSKAFYFDGSFFFGFRGLVWGLRLIASFFFGFRGLVWGLHFFFLNSRNLFNRRRNRSFSTLFFHQQIRYPQLDEQASNFFNQTAGLTHQQFF